METRGRKRNPYNGKTVELLRDWLADTVDGVCNFHVYNGAHKAAQSFRNSKDFAEFQKEEGVPRLTILVPDDTYFSVQRRGEKQQKEGAQ